MQMQDVFGCEVGKLEISEEFIGIASVDSEEIWEVVCSEEEKIEVGVDSEEVYVVGSEKK